MQKIRGLASPLDESGVVHAPACTAATVTMGRGIVGDVKSRLLGSCIQGICKSSI